MLEVIKMAEEISMIIKYWGVRGSIPAPLTTQQIREKEIALIKKIAEDGGTFNFKDDKAIREYLEHLPLSISGTYGGNTTCIEVRAKDSPLIVIDAGSGARDFGNYLIGRLFSGQHLNPLSNDEATKKDLHLLFTHYHWDHLQGFPFFGPAFIGIHDKKLNIHFYGKKDTTKTLSKVLAGQQQYPNFPVVWVDMPCKKNYKELGRMDGETIKIGNADIRYQELTHPDSVFAYRINVNGKSFVCATDTEHKDSADPRLVSLAKNADILYYDGQYTPEEYSGKKGPTKFDWGHSTYEWAINNALAAGVRLVILGHHDPGRDDFGIENILERALEFREAKLKLPENEGKKLEVVMAHEGLEQKL